MKKIIVEVIIFHSYKGGSGKTLFATNFAHLLHNKFNKRVLLIEADFFMPTYTDIFPKNNPTLFLNNYLNQTQYPIDHYIYPEPDADFGTIYCSKQFSISDNSLGLNQEWFIDNLNKMSNDFQQLNYDYIIFDLSPGFHLFVINTLVMANHVFLMMRPDFQSLRGVEILLKDVYFKVRRKEGVKLNIILNQIPKFNKTMKIVDKWEIKLGIKFDVIDNIFQIPFEYETNYNTIIKEMILPVNNSTSIEISNILQKIIKEK